ncbi:MAG: efflux RND transporter periplasmic adaptor subunit [Pseudomonadota bacterium]
MKHCWKIPSSMLLLTLVTVTATAQDEESESVAVTTTEVTSEALVPRIPAAGTVRSRHAAQITSGLTAQLEWVAEPGDFIEEGAPVATFNCAGLHLRLEELTAEAALNQIRFDSLGRELGRMEQALLATSALQIERVRADRDVAQGEMVVSDVRIRQTETELERCRIPAPFAGVVTRQLRRGGEDVPQGEVLASMTDIRQLEVRAQVPIRYLPRLALGVTGQVRLNDLELPGVVRTAVPAADETSQTFEVRLDLPATAHRELAAGQLVSVSLPLAADAALTVPRDAIVLRSDGAYVMRIDRTNVARQVPVQMHDATGERVAVSGGIRVGDRVAVRGAEALSDGDAVRVRDEALAGS